MIDVRTVGVIEIEKRSQGGSTPMKPMRISYVKQPCEATDRKQMIDLKLLFAEELEGPFANVT